MNKLYEESSVSAIADAIREKNGTEDKYKLSQMADAIRAISGGKKVVVEEWTPSADILSTTADRNHTHNLDFVPQMVLIMRDDFGGSSLPTQQNYSMLGGVVLPHIESRYAYTTAASVNFSGYFYATDRITEEQVILPATTNCYWRAGHTYYITYVE